ncbi:unnamed protein product [Trichobilharzia regenti]|nr:unnamed protein product [Trichobilharzia regenti]
MSMLLNRILSNEEQIVTSSIVVNCVNVFMAVMDKRKPESGFPVGGGAGESTETGSLIGYGIPGPKNDISCTNNKTINNTSNDSALLMTNGDDAVGGGGNKSSNDCDTSSINNRQQQQQQQQSVHDMNSLPIDKQHISKACENLSKACLSCLSELHKLLKTFHPVSCSAFRCRFLLLPHEVLYAIRKAGGGLVVVKSSLLFPLQNCEMMI